MLIKDFSRLDATHTWCWRNMTPDCHWLFYIFTWIYKLQNYDLWQRFCYCNSVQGFIFDIWYFQGCILYWTQILSLTLCWLLITDTHGKATDNSKLALLVATCMVGLQYLTLMSTFTVIIYHITVCYGIWNTVCTSQYQYQSKMLVYCDKFSIRFRDESRFFYLEWKINWK